MNIESLFRKIELFEELIIESGLKRDIEGYISSIAPQQNRQNLAMFKDIAEDLEVELGIIYGSDLPGYLADLLPDGKPAPFTAENHLKAIEAMQDDPNLAAPQFFTQLNKFLNTLKAQIETNEVKLKELKGVFEPYVDKTKIDIGEERIAIVSLIFKDDDTITNLKDFSIALKKWDRSLHNFHTLMSSKAPEKIELVEVQNGSIDVIVNIDIDIAVDFVELIKLGFQVFGGYLLYKSRTAEIIKTFFGNQKLIEQEKEREQAMLDNISEAIESKLKELHEKAKTADGQIDTSGVDVKINDVKSIISEHIVKGNDIKLLEAPEDVEEISKNADDAEKESVKNRRILDSLPPEELQKLIDKYHVENGEGEGEGE